MLRTIIVALALCAISFRAEAQDPKAKTFPLNRQMEDRAYACLSKEAAVEVVDTIATKGFEVASFILQVHVLTDSCGELHAIITYTGRVHQIEGKHGKWNVYEGKVGRTTVYVMTDWNHIEIRI